MSEDQFASHARPLVTGRRAGSSPAYGCLVIKFVPAVAPDNGCSLPRVFGHGRGA